VAPIAAGVFWRLVFDTRFGLVNAGLRALGLGTVRWTNEATPTLVVTLVAVTWRATPLLAVLLLGALRAVPPSHARAARMDGASAWQVLRHITLPAIRPTLVVVCVIQIVLALQVFDILFAIASGHPLTASTLTGFAIYTSVIENLSFGYGSALTVVLAGLIALCLVPLIFVVRGRVPRRARRVVDDDLDSRPPVYGHTASGAVTATRAGARVEPPPAVRRWRPGARAARVGRAFGIGAMAVWLVGPIVWLAIASTQPEAGLRAASPTLTLNLTLDGYTRLLNDPAWRGALAISVAVSVGATLLALASAVLAGYPLARYQFRGSGVVLGVLLLTQLIPPIALAIPFLFIVLAFGLKDTVFGLMLVNAAFWTPILVWLVRAAFLAVPTQLESAARMDGLGRVGTIFRVAVPAAGPAIAAAGVIVFIGIWNDFVFSAAIGGRTTTTLPRFLVLNADPPYHVLAAGILLTILPCLVLVAVMHRRILRAV
jgi:multiple sugar transport system permease protein